jgi:hypothetical protein
MNFICRQAFHTLVFAFLLLNANGRANAQESNPSTNATGMTGLNTVPSARMDRPGTMRLGVSTSDPYNHAFIGFQIAKPLYVNLRQTMEISSIGDRPDMVYPGMDLKLHLKEEGRYMPEIALGFDSLLGHRRFSSEYVALSKRYYDLDFTAGMVWGRMGSAGHLKNPLSRLSGHFNRDRDALSEDATNPSDLFTGKEIGFFGGVEYFTPMSGLTLKADFNGDDYGAEMRNAGFKRPSPWSIGFNYSPKEWISVGAAAIGFDKIMARLTFQLQPAKWSRKSYKDSKPFQFSAHRPDATWRNLPREMAEAENIVIGKTRVKGNDFSGILHLNDYQPSPMQIGRAARHLAASAGPEIETITIIPVSKGLRGKAVTLSRHDLEQAVAYDRGSPEEIWQDTSFETDRRSLGSRNQSVKIKFAPELAFSMGEEETTHLYRASLLVEQEKQKKKGIIMGTALRFNIADNLHRMAKYKDLSLASVRGDAYLFALNRVNLERAFLGFLRTPLPDFHFALTAGWLEEMYAGYGGEVLYRPFDSPFAIGAEAWKVYKRDALSPLAIDLYNETAVTGLLNLYYAVPDTNVTTFVKAGRFLGRDWGAQVGAQTQLANGMKIKGYVTASNSDDQDIFGGSRNLFAGVQMSIPLGDLKFVPQGSEARVKLAPIGRDDAALLDKPVDLYEVTEPMSYRHLGRNWGEILN